MASLESTSPKCSSAFESCHNVHCTFFFFFFFFFFFVALDNTDQCIHLGTRPAHHQLAFASGRAPVSFPVSYTIVCSRPEDGLRCRQGVKPPLKTQTPRSALEPCSHPLLIADVVFNQLFQYRSRVLYSNW